MCVCEVRHDQATDLTIHRLDRYVRAVSTRGSRAEYEVELTACFVFSINTALEGPPGLGIDEIEEMIEADWMWISLDTDILLESHWQLESIRERTVSDEQR